MTAVSSEPAPIVSREELEAFRNAVRESGMGRLIQDERVSWDEAKNEFRGFEIVG